MNRRWKHRTAGMTVAGLLLAAGALGWADYQLRRVAGAWTEVVDRASFEAAAQRVAVVNVLSHDGREMLPHRTVVVDEGRIVAVDAAATVPDGTRRIDGRGRFLVPGCCPSFLHQEVHSRVFELRDGEVIDCAAHSRELDQGSLGASDARLSPRGGDADWHQQGESNPGPLGLTSNDLSGRCNRGSRTLDTAVLSCINTDTGLDVITDVRAHSRPDLPVILVTGDTSSAMRELPHDRNLRLAAKPINADELLAMLHELEQPATASQ